MSLKGAICCSAAFHGMLLSVHPPAGLVPPKRSLHPIEVTYLASPSASTPPAAPVRPVVQDLVPIPKRVLPAPQSRSSRETPARPVPRVTPRVESTAPSSPVRSGPAQEAAFLPEGPFALVRHKQQVKERLKSHLTYPNLQIQGAVHLQVALNSEGTLLEASIIGPADPQLAEAALQGTHAANPYPRFPKEMRESKVAYDFLIQYRLE